MAGIEGGGRWERIGQALFRPIDAASVVAFRIAFGLLMAYEALQLLDHGYSQAWLDRAVAFSYPGFSWVQSLPGAWAHVHFYVLSLLALGIAAGALYRLCCALFFLGFSWAFLIDQTDYLNHAYLISLASLALVFLPAHHSLSVDAWLRPGLRSASVPAWVLYALRTHFGFVYFFGGVAKLEGDWLAGLPTGIWMRGHVTLPGLESVAQAEEFALFIAWGGLLLDLFVVPALLMRRTRPFAFLVAVGFHVTNSQIFHIGIFPWLAIAGTLLFFPPDWPRRVFRWPVGAPARPDAAPSGSVWTPRRRVCAGLAAFYLTLHVALPLRHWIYPGRAIWTEEGQPFAWRMMLREKVGLVVFKLEDPESGQSRIVDPADELTPRQVGTFVAYPLRIHQYARHLADRAEAEGSARPRVQALSLVALNGRRPVPIVDPTVDLAAEPLRVFSHAPWILALDDERFVGDPAWQDIARGLAETYGKNVWMR